jgi:hypothetical protein
MNAPVEAQAEPGTEQDQAKFQDAANALFERVLTRARNNRARKARDRQDWQNCLMYRGGASQWSIWDGDRYVERGTDPATGGIPAYVPRCTSNVFANKIDGIAAILDQSDPAKECGPGTDDDADRAAADVSEQAIPVLFEEMRYEQDRPAIHKLAALTDAVGYIVYYDNDARHGMESIPMYQCVQCQEFEEAAEASPERDEASLSTCKACGGMLQPAMDPRTGAVIGLEYPKGKLCGELVPSFELSRPSGARTADTTRLPWTLTHTRMQREDIIRAWPEAKKILEDSDGVSSGRSSDVGQHYADALVGLVAPAGNTTESESGHVVYRLWHDPIDDGEHQFPGGLFAVRVDDELVHAGPLPFKDEEGRPFKNILIRQFAQAPGTGFAKPPADDMAPLQTQRNIVESLIDLSLMNFAAPKEYVPLSVTFENEPTGAPGERVFYKTTNPGDRPSIAEGRSPAAGLYQRLEGIDKKFDEISKLNAVMQGERPAGDPTLGEIQVLQERGMAAFEAPISGLVQFETDLARMTLRIARQTMWSERFIKIRGENGGWEVKKFLGSDLAGRVDVYIERASAWPKSQLMQMLRIKEGVSLGILNPAEDPELQIKLLSELNLSRLKPTLDADRKQIARELDRWKDAMSPEEIAPPDALTQNLKLHEAQKVAWLKTEEAETAAVERPEVYQAMRQHIEQIRLMLNPPAAPVAPAGADPLGALLQSGAIKPAGAATAGRDPVNDLVAAGAITPAGPAPEGARA